MPTALRRTWEHKGRGAEIYLSVAGPLCLLAQETGYGGTGRAARVASEHT